MSDFLLNLSATPLRQVQIDKVYEFLQERFYHAQALGFPSGQPLPPQEFFQGEKDLQWLESAEKECPQYALTTGRAPRDILFNLATLISTYPQVNHDAQTGEPLYTFSKYVESSLRIGTLWSLQDRSEIDAEEERRRRNREAQRRFRETHPAPGKEPTEKMLRVKAAKEAWKEAVQKRKEAVQQWDSYVAHLRGLYIAARNSEG